MTKACSVCGIDFQPSRVNRMRCADCRAQDRRPVVEAVEKECVVCNEPFAATRKRTLACPQCSQVLAREKQYPRRTCPCGNVFHAAKRSSRELCRECEKNRICTVCGVTFPARNKGHGWYCSRLCSTTAALDRAGERVNALYSLACSKGLGGWDWRLRLYEVLIERDGPDCRLCGKPIDLTIKSGPKGSDEGPSIDHIHPRSLGGTDELDNLQMTHWGCNRSKSNRIGEVA